MAPRCVIDAEQLASREPLAFGGVTAPVQLGAALSRAAASGEIAPDTVGSRAALLASALMGAWLSVRIDPADAGALCETIAKETESWRIALAPPR